MATGVIQPSFTSGELSPVMYGRVDHAKYMLGLKTCRNFIVRPHGGLKNRPGTRFVGEVKDSTKKSRLVPFQYSTERTYCLEFGHQYMRVLTDGGFIEGGSNVVANGDFQSDLTGWIVTAPAGSTVSVVNQQMRLLGAEAQANLLTYGTARGRTQNWLPGSVVTVTLVSGTVQASRPIIFDARQASGTVYYRSVIRNSNLTQNVQVLVPPDGILDFWVQCTGGTFRSLRVSGSHVNVPMQQAYQWPGGSPPYWSGWTDVSTPPDYAQFQQVAPYEIVMLGRNIPAQPAIIPFVYQIINVLQGVKYRFSADVTILPGYPTGAGVRIGTSIGGSEILGRTIQTSGRVTHEFVAAQTTYHLYFQATGADIDNVSITSISELVTPYTESDLPLLRWTQSADVVTLTHPNYYPRQVQRVGVNDWRIITISDLEGPFDDINVDQAAKVYSSGTSGTVTLTSDTDVFSQDLAGTMMYLEAISFGSLGRWEPGGQIAAAGENPVGLMRANGNRIYRCVTNVVAQGGGIIRCGGVPPVHTEGIERDGDGRGIHGYTPDVFMQGVEWEYVCDRYGTARITSVTNARRATATVTRTLPPMIQSLQSANLVINGAFNADLSGWIATGSETIWESGMARLGAAIPDPDTGGWSYVDGTIDQSFTTTQGLPMFLRFTLTVAKQITVSIGSQQGGTQYVSQQFNASGSFEISFTPGTVQTWIRFSTTGGGTPQSHSYVDNVEVSRDATRSGTHRWAKQAWRESTGYPYACSYHQQRFIFGGSPTKPQTVWMSSLGEYVNFRRSIPVEDDDGITFTMDSRQVNEIRHFIVLSELIALTAGSEWLIRGDGQSGAITPSSVQARAQGFNGSANVPPLTIGTGGVYVQNKGGAIRNIAYEFSADQFIGKDLTVLSSHLFDNRRVVDWTYAQEPYSCVWVVMDDGSLLGLTYMPEQEVIGWHRHDTDGLYESVCAVTEDDLDAVYVIVKRTIGGVTRRYIERFAIRVQEDLTQSYFVDCGLTHGVGDFTSCPICSVAGGWTAHTVFTGLTHLEGKTVAILADGVVQAQQVVTGGAITLTSAATVVSVGLPYVSDIVTLPIAVPQQMIMDKRKLINKVTLLVDKSHGGYVGPDASNLYEIQHPSGLDTGLSEIHVVGAWDKYGSVMIRQSEPLPLSILAVMPEVTVAGA